MKRSIFILTLICQSMSGQEKLNFDQCLKRAFEHNYNIYRQKNKENTYKLLIKQAQDARLPNVNSSLNGNSNWGRGIDPFTNTYVNQQFNSYSLNLGVQMNLFNGFYHLHNIKLQKQNLELNHSEWQQIKNSLTIDMAMRYTNILYFTEIKENVKKQIQLSHTNVTFTQSKINAGTIAKREIYKALAQKEAEELNLIRVENDLATNLLELKLLLNMDVEKEIVLDSFPNISIQDPHSQSYIKASLSSSPNLKQNEINIKKAEITLQRSKSSFYPSISLGGNLGSAYSTNNRLFNFEKQVENNFSYGLGISAQVPIFSQFQTRNKVKEALLNIESAKIQYEIEKQNQMKIITKAFLDLKTSQKKYEVSQSSLKSNEINFETEKLKYENGRINLLEFNITKSNYFNALVNNIKDKYEYLFNKLVFKIYEGESEWMKF